MGPFVFGVTLISVRFAWSILSVAALLLLSGAAQAQPSATASAPSKNLVLLDRVVVRWYAPETGGVRQPQFIFERELAFEARIEALADPDPQPGLYSNEHVRAALDRHIAETLLANLPITPSPTPKEIADRAESARSALEQRVHGRERLLAIAAAEGIASDELDTLLRRQARASIYLDRMVAPMLEPSEFELRAALRSGTTPFKNQPYEQVAPALMRWYVGQRLAQALDNYFQNARSRVTVNIVR